MTFKDSMTRLASFRYVKQDNVFFSKLADAGFYYSNTEVICHGCGNRKPISSIVSDPDGSDYHLDGCSFSRTDAVSTLVTEPTQVGPVDNDSSADHRDCGGAFARPDVRVYTVPMGHPANPAYITLQKRLESFRQWPADHIHSPASLARSGFYYAGYSDCVRCFYCGLGLKSWKPGDDIVDQHQKFRPSCHFLLRQTGQQQSHVIQKEYTNNAKVTLLKKENDVLRSQLKCKVCNTANIKDLFLPCGDLYACGDCSKSLTHCPACNKQILATVTTFFT
ncbi:putative inhibitor of apoptosis [Physella acuta]|uniref:putative inhibitor of apoptosis n=1 Tax=Physella acuta TaxID=109671 RepID=UPI0027DC30F3|nr:putative inhibitor of apoptosis [Physella acuta]